MRRPGVVIALGVLTLAASAGAACPRWRIHNLGTLPAPFNRGSEATGLNAHGVVIGMSFGRVGQQAFVWRNGKMQPLPSLGGLTYANAIANNGDVAGEAVGAHEASHHAILWHAGKLIDLGSLGGRLSRAIVLNDHGQVVGDSSTATGTPHAFLWQNGSMTDLGTLGGTQSEAVAINEVGQVIGTSTTTSGAQHAFLWQNGKMADLGSLSDENSTATAIDAKGNVVGFTNPGIYDPDHAVVWRNGVQLQDLGNFGSRVKQAIAINTAGQILVSTFRPDTHAFIWTNDHAVEIGRRYTAAHGINDRGWVVGTALFRKKGPQVPFVWHNGRMTALPTLDGSGPPTSAAYQINDSGWIAGRSYAAAGDRAVVWTPK